MSGMSLSLGTGRVKFHKMKRKIHYSIHPKTVGAET
jgi:hypothetical protein